MEKEFVMSNTIRREDILSYLDFLKGLPSANARNIHCFFGSWLINTNPGILEIYFHDQMRFISAILRENNITNFSGNMHAINDLIRTLITENIIIVKNEKREVNGTFEDHMRCLYPTPIEHKS